MQHCLGSQVYDTFLIYLDNEIVYLPDFTTHLQHLERVFNRLQEHRPKLQPHKFRLFQCEVTYLGHVVNHRRVATDSEKTAAVRDWLTPVTVRQVHSFLGFAGYYRRFIPAFSRVAAPLNQLLQGNANQPSSAAQWTPECQAAFDALKQALLSVPILAYANFQLPFRLYANASLDGLRAVLSQVQDKKERVIAYTSRSLHLSERSNPNVSSFKMELWALKFHQVSTIMAASNTRTMTF